MEPPGRRNQPGTNRRGPCRDTVAFARRLATNACPLHSPPQLKMKAQAPEYAPCKSVSGEHAFRERSSASCLTSFFAGIHAGFQPARRDPTGRAPLRCAAPSRTALRAPAILACARARAENWRAATQLAERSIHAPFRQRHPCRPPASSRGHPCPRLWYQNPDKTETPAAWGLSYHTI